MIVAGCDIGSRTAKAVIMEDSNILAACVMRDKPDPEESAREVMAQALAQAGMRMDQVERCVGTGYGRKQVTFAQAVESEIVCHGRGAQWLEPSIRMVIDIGGQDAKAIKLDEKGKVIRYAYNDKCAAGTGRFLEVMAKPLGVRLEDLGSVSQKSTTPVKVSNQCVIFAETEIVSLINAGKPVPDIVCGLHRAMAHRVAALAKGIVVEGEVGMTGGVAKNEGMFNALEEALGVKIHKIGWDPQMVGAIGAALIAREMVPSA
ncbi:MAG: acyl-CoA dehydratase activase [Syntrophaceae bacterium]